MTPRQKKGKGIGEWSSALFSALLLLLVAVGIVVFGLLLLALSPFILGVAFVRRLRKGWLVRRFRRDYASRGTVAILVYSESPNWKAYFERKVIPDLGDRAEVLNWSKRRDWEKQSTLPIRVYLHHRPKTGSNPYGMVVGPKGPLAHYPFFLAFRDYKHGKPRALEKAFRDFWDGIEKAERAWGQH
ncbi:MAG: hypothetical protein HKO65_12305 [Gemmatimonadetes bacterium]|nr:hypothetical protein [Gemmatimonadota bacterium]